MTAGLAGTVRDEISGFILCFSVGALVFFVLAAADCVIGGISNKIGKRR